MKKLISLSILLFCCIISTRCGSSVTSSSGEEASSMQYARYLNISEGDSCTFIELFNPWKTGSVLHRYALIPKENGYSAPDGWTAIHVPVESMVIYTGTHACIMEELGCTNSIKGVCESRYIMSDKIKAMVRQGLICDVGDSYSPDIEKIATLKPDIIISSPFENGTYGAAEKLNIPIVEGADYMENLPLGRTEWIKFFGLLTGCRSRADSIFADTEKRYLKLCSLTANPGEKCPTVIAEKKYGGSWGLACRDSYIANIYRDAGGDYLFNDIPGSGSIKESFEKVMERGIHSDVWLFKYASQKPFSYGQLLAEYSLYGEFDAFKERRIYACNTLSTPYYRDITLHPDRILEDLIHIFHPTLIPEREDRVRYFIPLSKDTDIASVE